MNVYWIYVDFPTRFVGTSHISSSMEYLFKLSSSTSKASRSSPNRFDFLSSLRSLRYQTLSD
jgi:hypothetical protein